MESTRDGDANKELEEWAPPCKKRTLLPVSGGTYVHTIFDCMALLTAGPFHFLLFCLSSGELCTVPQPIDESMTIVTGMYMLYEKMHEQ